MMKKICLFLLILILPAVCFATPNQYYKLNNRCNIADLNADIYRWHSTGSDWKDGVKSTTEAGTGFYYRDQVLLSLGATQMNVGNTAWGSITLDVDPNTSFVYVLSGDNKYMRPFGIDIFARGNTGSRDLTLTTAELHLGKQNGPVTNSYTATVTADDITSGGIKSVWWDVCLVLDGNVNVDDPDKYNTVKVLNDATYYHVTESDSFYMATLNFTLTCTSTDGLTIISQDYSAQIMGYYGREQPTEEQRSLMFILTKTAETDNINLLEKTGWFTVASFDFVTDSHEVNTEFPGDYHIFLSGSPNDTDERAGQPFAFHYIGTRDAVNKDYDLGFTARIVTTDPSTGSPLVIPFDGTATSTTYTEYMNITTRAFKAKDNNYYAQWRGSGTIEVELDDVAALDLHAGRYESNIFIHITSD